ncbi:hypothetical protein K6L44_01335 [Gluconacetobacter entanii]|uniref:hypothetical protein n=1 Tax=Gluconacetobacter entanii TaxID=108528 RepID=UPI001C93251C|nr:hypothetical protein [Gluconacetobacter entanii]MBY4638663.1 hypothetical protein [Gluconacetobacter entanii]MCW4579321.1 hypothetical protein [Gluconacetobacter entanii]MCW4582719.1 hypothetical protein [Gluconacetobacter entanii]MCW4586133.1 hypothetical protein [Gluconacetobacter entanii]
MNMTPVKTRSGAALMRACLASAVAGVLAVSAGAVARAADAPAQDSAAQSPFVTPQHDVDVTYTIYPPHATQMTLTQRMRWSEARMMQRIDPGNTGTYMITDYRAKTLTVIDPDRHIKTVVPAPGAASVDPSRRAEGTWLRTGGATVAGHSCTLWQTSDTDQRPSEICYTDDGVMLEVVRDGKVMVEASSISTTPQDSSTFDIPSGLKEVKAANP